MVYDLDNTDRANRAVFERTWAAQRGIPVEDLQRLGYVAVATSYGADGRPIWDEMMVLGPCLFEMTIDLSGVL